MKFPIHPFLLCMAVFAVTAEPHKEFPQVDDTSFTEADGSRVIRLSTAVWASTNEIWQALTTTEGWKSYAVAFASVDMRIGGIIETSYNREAHLGDPNNIKNEIVAYIPGKMLAIRCVQAPLNFEHKKEFFATGTVLEIFPIDAAKSRVVLTAVGYKPGEAYDSLFAKFRWGDAFTLDKLRLHFEPKTSAPDSTKPPGVLK